MLQVGRASVVGQHGLCSVLEKNENHPKKLMSCPRVGAHPIDLNPLKYNLPARDRLCLNSLNCRTQSSQPLAPRRCHCSVELAATRVKSTKQAASHLLHSKDIAFFTLISWDWMSAVSCKTRDWRRFITLITSLSLSRLS